jgi:hypothetical protein
MIKDIIVIDDILPKSYQDFIEENLLGMHVPWVHVRDVAIDDDSLKEMEKKNIKLNLRPGFSCRFYQVGEGITSPLWFMIKPIVLEACSKIDYKINDVISARSFLITSLADHKEYDNPHTDMAVSHLVCLYYVNDTDGDTYIFDKSQTDVSREMLDRDNLKVIKRISPKKGRVVLFDGNTYHSSSRPSTGSRCIINFDIL